MKLRPYTKPGWNKNSEGDNYETISKCLKNAQPHNDWQVSDK